MTAIRIISEDDDPLTIVSSDEHSEEDKVGMESDDESDGMVSAKM